MLALSILVWYGGKTLLTLLTIEALLCDMVICALVLLLFNGRHVVVWMFPIPPSQPASTALAYETHSKSNPHLPATTMKSSQGSNPLTPLLLPTALPHHLPPFLSHCLPAASPPIPPSQPLPHALCHHTLRATYLPACLYSVSRLFPATCASLLSLVSPHCHLYLPSLTPSFSCPVVGWFLLLPVPARTHTRCLYSHTHTTDLSFLHAATYNMPAACLPAVPALPAHTHFCTTTYCPCPPAIFFLPAQHHASAHACLPPCHTCHLTYHPFHDTYPRHLPLLALPLVHFTFL